MPYYAFIAADLIAICLMVFGLYYPRHRRRDLIVAFLSINVGVMGVTYAMTNADISLGFGMGIFAVLSIIRLRSTEMDHAEIAYYFTAIALGLLGGFPALSPTLSFTLMAVLLGVIFVGDHPALFRRTRQQTMVLDQAFTTEEGATEYLEALLGAKVHHATIRKVDLLNESTVVDVRYTLHEGAERPVADRMASVALSPEVAR
ncbi:DUF4956 domain-containing protein [Demequina mangrovi]|uniref:DUF4956 domain-containing protein n=1 Tax=Demequina mangrovi TaxID=1043493 RepID=A0A1H6VWZ3_9MICO|nr:DUF4956 domain-containing protein [Demequina mangrovi]SEJ09191.1 protein of unknown function [Demequina mangrovi]